MDWNRIESHTLLGEVHLKLNTLPEGQSKEGWYKLGGASKDVKGEIHIIAHFTPTSSAKPLLIPNVILFK